MGKTKPIGVRFDEELLNKVKGASLATSPQKALNLYERSYVELIEMKVAENNKPENKERIEKERNTVSEVSENSQHKQPLTETECTPNPPTTLDELKALCPKELKGFERSQWISGKRVEYGI